uniref:Putative secreted protein n=1 Tax=Anopheles triannulatus TaxID=58253 RepID=A0A2M4B231_9DIPT
MGTVLRCRMRPFLAVAVALLLRQGTSQLSSPVESLADGTVLKQQASSATGRFHACTTITVTARYVRVLLLVLLFDHFARNLLQNTFCLRRKVHLLVV